MTDHLEIRAVELRDNLRIEVAPFYRHQTGTIMADPTKMGVFSAIDNLDIYGVDVIGGVKVHRTTELGGGYSHVRAKSDASDDAIPRLPRNKWEAWTRATPDPRVTLLARVMYFGDSYQGTTLTPSYTLIQASMASQITR